MSPVSITNFTVCRTCGGLNGYPEGRDQYPQVCRCHQEKQERWPDHDFNEYLTLCWCCQLAVIASGSRWSPFYCPDCRDLARGYNERVGTPVLYMGRHSVMNGVGLWGRDINRPGAIEAFGGALGDFVDGVGKFQEAMDEWRPNRLGVVLQARQVKVALAGQPEGLDLTEYLRVTWGLADDPDFGKQAAFLAMVKFLRDRPAEEE